METMIVTTQDEYNKAAEALEEINITKYLAHLQQTPSWFGSWFTNIGASWRP